MTVEEEKRIHKVLEREFGLSQRITLLKNEGRSFDEIGKVLAKIAKSFGITIA